MSEVPFDGTDAGPGPAGVPLLRAVATGAVGHAPLPDGPGPDPDDWDEHIWVSRFLVGVVDQGADPPPPPDPVVDALLAVLGQDAPGRWDPEDREWLRWALAAVPTDRAARIAHLVSELGAPGAGTGSGGVPARTGPGEDPSVDPLMEELTALVRWAIDTGTERAVVAAGIMLAGVCPDLAGRRAAIVTLGRHEALAPAAIRTLWSSGDDAGGDPGDGGLDAVFGLAQELTGWGRIHAVDALAAQRRPDIRRWLLTDGFRNDFTWGLLALLIAREADLAGYLADQAVAGRWDGDILDGARDLLSTLLDSESPGGWMPQYPRAADAVLSWLDGRLRSGGTTLADVDLAVGLLDHLSHPKLVGQYGFSPDQLAVAVDRCRLLCRGEAAVSAVHRALEDGPDLRTAVRVAPVAGVDAFPALLRQIEAAPWDAQWWYWAKERVGPHAPELVEAAQRLLPADGIGTDPRSTIGAVPAVHLGVAHVLRVLRHEPGLGWTWIRPMLDSDLFAIRDWAVATVRAWPRDRWPDDAESRLRRVLDRDPEEALRARLRRTLG